MGSCFLGLLIYCAVMAGVMIYGDPSIVVAEVRNFNLSSLSFAFFPLSFEFFFQPFIFFGSDQLFLFQKRHQGVHQEYGDCRIVDYDLSNYARFKYLCAQDYNEDFVFNCVEQVI